MAYKNRVHAHRSASVVKSVTLMKISRCNVVAFATVSRIIQMGMNQAETLTDKGSVQSVIVLRVRVIICSGLRPTMGAKCPIVEDATNAGNY